MKNRYVAAAACVVFALLLGCSWICQGQTTANAITFTVISDHQSSDPPFTVSATSQNAVGPAITYAVVSGPATISGTTVTLTGVAGKVTLQANQAAGNGFDSGTQETSFNVATAACSGCYASFGAGSVLNSTKFGDYNDQFNILQSTHLGASTPQYAVGVSYRMAIPGPFYKVKGLNCNQNSFANSAGYC